MQMATKNHCQQQPIIMQQPIHQTNVIVQSGPPQHAGRRNWSSGLCDCCKDMGTCILGLFCPVILAMMVSSRMGESCCVPCCVPGSTIVLRTKVRSDRNIEGTIMDDCCMSTICTQLVLCQISREVDKTYVN